MFFVPLNGNNVHSSGRPLPRRHPNSLVSAPAPVGMKERGYSCGRLRAASDAQQNVMHIFFLYNVINNALKDLKKQYTVSKT